MNDSTVGTKDEDINKLVVDALERFKRALQNRVALYGRDLSADQVQNILGEMYTREKNKQKKRLRVRNSD